MAEGESTGSVQKIFENLKRLATLHLDYARLTAAEKLTIILSTMAMYALAVVFGTLALLFLTFGIGHWLATTLAPHLAYIYVAAFYVVLLVLLFVFRKPLFVNPIARFVSKLFVNPPKED